MARTHHPRRHGSHRVARTHAPAHFRRTMNRRQRARERDAMVRDREMPKRVRHVDYDWW